MVDMMLEEVDAGVVTILNVFNKMIRTKTEDCRHTHTHTLGKPLRLINRCPVASGSPGLSF